jgi:hypothetical protein
MKSNMGKFDRVIRILIAAITSTLYITGIISGTLGVVLLIVGAVLLLTSVINFCPLYKIFGISTCKVKNN